MITDTASAYCDANGEAAPWLAPSLLGHKRPQAILCRAVEQASLSPAWLMTGMRGIGKATLAWQFAKFLLHHGTQMPMGGIKDFAIPSDTRTMKLVANGAHPDLCHVHPIWDARRKHYKQTLGVEAIRQAKSFFGLSSGLAGWRICVIDSADDLTLAAANALLKILEEPPLYALFLIICHQPGRLLPTIRSRCQQLHLSALTPPQIMEILGWHYPELPQAEQQLLAQLGQGSAKQALNFAQGEHARLYQDLLDGLKSLPDFPYEQIEHLAERLTKVGAGATTGGVLRFGELLLGVLQRIIHYGIGQRQALLQGEEALAQHFCARAPIASIGEAWESIARDIHRAHEFNLDGREVVFGYFSTLAQMLGRHA